jgi:hypothetical protein
MTSCATACCTRGRKETCWTRLHDCLHTDCRINDGQRIDCQLRYQGINMCGISVWHVKSRTPSVAYSDIRIIRVIRDCVLY